MTEFAYFQPKHTIYFQCSINLSTRFVLIDECAYVLRLNAFSFHFILFRWFRLISDLVAFCILKPFVHNGKNISFRAHYDGSRIGMRRGCWWYLCDNEIEKNHLTIKYTNSQSMQPDFLWCIFNCTHQTWHCRPSFFISSFSCSFNSLSHDRLQRVLDFFCTFLEQNYVLYKCMWFAQKNLDGIDK